MKKLLSLLQISVVLSLTTPFITNARDLAWTGSSSGNWNDSANFSPMFVPTANDTVTIDAATHHPRLTNNASAYRLVLLDDTFDLNGYQLNIANEALFSGGWLVDGQLNCRGTIATFAGTVINAAVDVDCTTLQLNGSVFNQSCNFKAETGDSQGGNTFMAPVSLVHVGAAGESITMALENGDTFHDSLYVNNITDGNIHLTQADTSYFKNCVRLASTGDGSIHFGREGGISILETNGHLVVENGEFTAGQLFIKNIEQQNATGHRMVLTGTGSSDEHSLLALESCHFTGDVDFTSPNLLLSINRFEGTALFTKTGGYDNVSKGDNLFSGDASFTNSSTTGHLLLTGSREDRFLASAEFTSGSTKIIAGYGATTIFEGNVVVNASTVGFYRLKFTGEAEQTLSGTNRHRYGEAELDKKSGLVTTAIPVEIDRRMTFTKGYLVTDSVNLITFLAGANATGASDASFVSGPVKKVGNTAFEFPVGKDGHYRPVGISAPDSMTDAFVGEYFDIEQSSGSGMDTSLYKISDCDYWTLNRNTGSSEVYIILYWKNESCHAIDTNDVRIANFNGGVWNNEGNADNGALNGLFFVRSAIQQNNYGHFTLAYIQGGNSCQSSFDLNTAQVCNDSLHQTINKVIWYNFTCDSLSIKSKFYNLNASSGEYFIEKVELYQGNCTGLRYLGGKYAPIFLDSLTFTADALDTSFSNQYFIKITKKDTSVILNPDTLKFKFCILPEHQVINPFIAFENICGLDYVVGAVQLNQRQSPGAIPSIGNALPATISIIPPGVGTQIIGAYLYLTGVSNSVPNVANATLTVGVNQTNIPLVLIAQDNAAGGTCWSFVNSNFSHTYAFRADILPLVNNTEANYIIDNLPVSNLVDWDGASIILIFQDCSGATRKGSIYLRDGLQVMTGGGFYSTTFQNLFQTASNTYTNDVGFINVSDVEANQQTFFNFIPGNAASPLPITSANGVTVPNNFYNVSFQNNAVVNGISGNATTFTIDNNSTDCYAVTFAGVYFEEADVFCNAGACNCDENETYCFNNITVTSSATWTPGNYPGTGCPGGILTLDGDLIVNPGVVLTLEGVQIRFGPNSRLIVRRGGGTNSTGAWLRITNGTLLTSINNTCMWQGVQVYGYRNQPIISAGQGYIYMVLSEISYAHEAILLGRRDGSSYVTTHTGGWIESIKESTFRDNNTSIRFPTTYYFERYFNIFDNVFLCEAPLRDAIYNQNRSEYFIDAIGNTSFPFSSVYTGIWRNRFENTPVNWLNRTIGIRAFSTRRLPINDNDFVNVDMGIVFTGNGTTNSVFGLNNFSHVNRGIWNRNNQWNSLRESDFTNGVGIAPAGIINQKSPATRIRDNDIDGFRDGIQLISSSGVVGDVEVWKNTITNTPRPLLAGGNNKFSTWRCNILDDYNPAAWRIYDISGVADIQDHGNSGTSFPNEFLLAFPDPTLDIWNTGSFTLNYFELFSNFHSTMDPDVVSTGVIVTYTGGQDACSSLRIGNRDIDDILSQRDTSYGDSSLLATINGEVMEYYLNKMEYDSLINFFDSLGVGYSDPFLFHFYSFINNIDSMRSVISRFPSSSQDEQDLIEFFTLYCDLNEDTLTFYNMNTEQKELLEYLAEKDNEAGELAKDVLNAIFGIPIYLGCEARADCEEERFGAAIVPEVDIHPSYTVSCTPIPASDRVTISSNIMSSSSMIIVYNHLNQVMLSTPVTDDKNAALDIKSLSNGVYYICIKNKNKCSATGKLVVLR